MKRIFGNTGGLKANQIKRLEKLYNRRIPQQYVITPELAHDVSRISSETRRQVGLLINRSGKIIRVIIGDYHRIVIPDISDYRTSPGRLKGLRCVHTHLNKEPLSRDDYTDLALLRLDLMAVITIAEDGRAHQIMIAHLLPGGSEKNPIRSFEPLRPHQTDIGCYDLITALESELAHLKASFAKDPGKERAILVSATNAPSKIARQSLNELKALCDTSRIEVIATVIQKLKQGHSRFIIGRGKLTELTLTALTRGATLIIFDRELNPSQIRSITDQIDLKVIDRTQLILDIFARRAQTREGKLQVELAQLKYLLPRLVLKNTAMSRLTGGIGGRGPGETKLEINRRRVRDRIKRLEKDIDRIKAHRSQQRSKRSKRRLPVVSIIGYTNAGKSTLLNTLTGSRVVAEDRLFATLDPASRRLRFPRDREVIITDTVGFIHNLPADLMAAFRATLEELENADLFLHMVDISNPDYKNHIRAVEKILFELKVNTTPCLIILNKKDRVDPEMVAELEKAQKGISISANNRDTLKPLTDAIEAAIQPLSTVQN
jgi:GTP-binding protein HflX